MQDVATLAAERWNVEKKRIELDAEIEKFYNNQVQKCLIINESSNKKAVDLSNDIYFKIKWANPPMFNVHGNLLIAYCRHLLKHGSKVPFPGEVDIKVWTKKMKGTKLDKLTSELNKSCFKLFKIIEKRDNDIASTQTKLIEETDKLNIKKDGELRFMMENNKSKRDDYFSIWSLANSGSIRELEVLLNSQNKMKTYKRGVNEPDPDFGLTPLHYVCRRENMDALHLVLKYGADIHIRAPDGRTPLHFAAAYSNKYIILELLARGSDYHALDNYGCSALDLAKQNKNHKTISTLMNWTGLVPPSIIEKSAEEILENSAGYVPEEYQLPSQETINGMTPILRLLSRRLNNYNQYIRRKKSVLEELNVTSPLNDTMNSDVHNNTANSLNLEYLNIIDIPDDCDHELKAILEDINKISHDINDKFIEIRLCSKHYQLCVTEGFQLEAMKSIKRRWLVCKQLIQLREKRIELYQKKIAYEHELLLKHEYEIQKQNRIEEEEKLLLLYQQQTQQQQQREEERKEQQHREQELLLLEQQQVEPQHASVQLLAEQQAATTTTITADKSNDIDSNNTLENVENGNSSFDVEKSVNDLVKRLHLTTEAPQPMVNDGDQQQQSTQIDYDGNNMSDNNITNTNNNNHNSNNINTITNNIGSSNSIHTKNNNNDDLSTEMLDLATMERVDLEKIAVEHRKNMKRIFYLMHPKSDKVKTPTKEDIVKDLSKDLLSLTGKSNILWEAAERMSQEMSKFDITAADIVNQMQEDARKRNTRKSVFDDNIEDDNADMYSEVTPTATMYPMPTQSQIDMKTITSTNTSSRNNATNTTLVTMDTRLTAINYENQTGKIRLKFLFSLALELIDVLIARKEEGQAIMILEECYQYCNYYTLEVDETFYIDIIAKRNQILLFIYDYLIKNNDRVESDSRAIDMTYGSNYKVVNTMIIPPSASSSSTPAATLSAMLFSPPLSPLSRMRYDNNNNNNTRVSSSNNQNQYNVTPHEHSNDDISSSNNNNDTNNDNDDNGGPNFGDIRSVDGLSIAERSEASDFRNRLHHSVTHNPLALKHEFNLHSASVPLIGNDNNVNNNSNDSSHYERANNKNQQLVDDFSLTSNSQANHHQHNNNNTNKLNEPSEISSAFETNQLNHYNNDDDDDNRDDREYNHDKSYSMNDPNHNSNTNDNSNNSAAIALQRSFMLDNNSNYLLTLSLQIESLNNNNNNTSTSSTNNIAMLNTTTTISPVQVRYDILNKITIACYQSVELHRKLYSNVIYEPYSLAIVFEYMAMTRERQSLNLQQNYIKLHETMAMELVDTVDICHEFNKLGLEALDFMLQAEIVALRVNGGADKETLRIMLEGLRLYVRYHLNDEVDLKYITGKSTEINQFITQFSHVDVVLAEKYAKTNAEYLALSVVTIREGGLNTNQFSTTRMSLKKSIKLKKAIKKLSKS